MPKNRAAKRVSAKATPREGAQTLVYIHGVGNKPREDVLRCQWDTALFGFRLGERSRMAYWCQTDRHGPPSEGTCGNPDTILNEVRSPLRIGARALAHSESPDRFIDEIGRDPKQRQSLRNLFDEIGASSPPSGRRANQPSAKWLERIDYPDFMVRLILGAFGVDVADFSSATIVEPECSGASRAGSRPVVARSRSSPTARAP